MNFDNMYANISLNVTAPLQDALTRIANLQSDKSLDSEWRKREIAAVAKEASFDINQLAGAERVDLEKQAAVWQQQAKAGQIQPAPQDYPEMQFVREGLRLKADFMTKSELFAYWSRALDNADGATAYVLRADAEWLIRAKQPAEPVAKELGLDNNYYTSEQRAQTPLGHEFDELVARTDYFFSNAQAREARANLAELPKLRAHIDSVAADARRQLPSDAAPTWSL